MIGCWYVLPGASTILRQWRVLLPLGSAEWHNDGDESQWHLPFHPGRRSGTRKWCPVGSDPCHRWPGYGRDVWNETFNKLDSVNATAKMYESFFVSKSIRKRYPFSCMVFTFFYCSKYCDVSACLCGVVCMKPLPGPVSFLFGEAAFAKLYLFHASFWRFSSYPSLRFLKYARLALSQVWKIGNHLQSPAWNAISSRQTSSGGRCATLSFSVDARRQPNSAFFVQSQCLQFLEGLGWCYGSWDWIL